MKRSAGLPNTANLSQLTHHHLKMYALAASAAGVGVLALAPPAGAKIIYTPANENIGTKTFLDLNHDGINDFKFIDINSHHGARHLECSSSSNGTLAVYGVRPANKVFGQSIWASALPAGSYVGPAGNFLGEKMAWAVADCGAQANHAGFWAGGSGRGIANRYLGLKFAVKGKIHFGWARLSVSISGANIAATLTGYAYETVPGKLIVAGREKDAVEPGEEDFGSGARLTNPTLDAPQPASLGALALGAQGFPLWRRKESALEPDAFCPSGVA